MEQSEKRIALVTGANMGIGLEIARQLGRAGLTVVLGARDAGRGRQAADRLTGEGLDASTVPLDVTDAQSVGDAAALLSEKYGRLDVLVNNAGVNDREDGPPTNASVDAVRRVMETNFLGALVVVQAMLPLLRLSADGRIVNLSSTLGSLAGNSDPSSAFHEVRLIGYNASKAALNMLTVQLAGALKETGILVNAACPGFARTDLNGNTGHISTVEAAATPVRLALLRGDGPTGKFFDVAGEVSW